MKLYEDLYESHYTAEEPEEEYVAKTNHELQTAWDIIEETGANLFLTGRAGTGKTTFLRTLRAESKKRMVVLAPTGVAAINARGTTIHSFFQLPFAPYIPGKGFAAAEKRYLNVSRQKRRLIASLSLLVIDEISMVRPDTLDAIDSILRRLRSSRRPFGGLQLLLIGDLRQLPPVVRDQEWQLLKDYYPSPYFFESHALKDAGFQTVELSMVFRQSDARFLEILNAIRNGSASYDILTRINERCIPGFNPAESEGYIRLTTHNRNAAAINDSRLAALTAPLFAFEAEVEGEFPESAYPADKTLILKEGAQVMFNKNDTGAYRRYYNGMLGIVESISEGKICVRPLQGGELIEVDQTEWDNTRYAVDPHTDNVMQETVGVFRQYPLQLAWAITIHKSQGLTFDRAIIDASHSFAAGQTYVALSRCRTLEGLVLEAPISPGAVIIDSGISDFIQQRESSPVTKEQISSLKEAYILTLLNQLFDFNPLRRSYDDFSRLAIEYIVPLYPSLESDIHDRKKEIKDRLCIVGERFVASYAGQPLSSLLADPSSGLAERIKNGCLYFLDILNRLLKFLTRLPRDIDNAEYARRLNTAFDALKYAIEFKRLTLTHLSDVDFSVKAYLDAAAQAVLQLEGMPRSKPKTAKEKPSKEKPQKEKKEKKPKGYSTFETLSHYREGKSLEQIAVDRNLKLTTIHVHIKELVRLGRIDIHDFVDESTIEAVRKWIAAHPDNTFTEQYELFNESRPANPMPRFLFSLCRDDSPK